MNYKNAEGENTLLLRINLLHEGSVIHIKTHNWIQFRNLQYTHALLASLAILCPQLPGISFGYDAKSNSVQLHTTIFVHHSHLSARQLQMHIDLLLKTVDTYAKELYYAAAEGKIHPNFIREKSEQTAIVQLEHLLDELQNLVKAVEESSDEDSESSHDLEWL